MTAARRPARLRAALPWAALAAGLAIATYPAWRLLVFGYAPTLDDLLTLRCFGV